MSEQAEILEQADEQVAADPLPTERDAPKAAAQHTALFIDAWESYVRQSLREHGGVT